MLNYVIKGVQGNPIVKLNTNTAINEITKNIFLKIDEHRKMKEI